MCTKKQPLHYEAEGRTRRSQLQLAADSDGPQRRQRHRAENPPARSPGTARPARSPGTARAARPRAQALRPARAPRGPRGSPRQARLRATEPTLPTLEEPKSHSACSLDITKSTYKSINERRHKGLSNPAIKHHTTKEARSPQGNLKGNQRNSTERGEGLAAHTAAGRGEGRPWHAR